MEEKVKKTSSEERPASEKENRSADKSVGKKRVSAGTVVGIILCVILVPILIANVAMIIQSESHPDRVPGVFGYSPMIVLSDSMEPKIMEGDLIFIKAAQPDQIQTGDIISFFDVSMGDGKITTHRVLKIEQDEKGQPVFTTGGDNNPKYRKEDGSWVVPEDPTPVKADKLVGIYQSRIPKIGKFVDDMQKPIGDTHIPIGYVIFVGVPLVLLIAYEFIRRSIFDKTRKKDTDALLAELEALRAQQAASAAAEGNPAEENKDKPAEENPGE